MKKAICCHAPPKSLITSHNFGNFDICDRQLTLNFEKKLIIRQILKDGYKESLLYCISNSKVFLAKFENPAKKLCFN